MGSDVTLKLFVLGLTAVELKLLSRVVELSEKRSCHLVLLPDEQASSADVCIINYSYPLAQQWVVANERLVMNKPVIWIEAKNTPDMHLQTQRPVQWSQLLRLIKHAILKKRGFTEENVDFSDTSVLRRIQPLNKQDMSVVSIHDTVAQTQMNTGLVNGKNTQTLEPSVQPIPAEDRKKILVVDDSQTVRDHLKTELEKLNYHVTLAKNGMEAIELYNPTRVDCIFMDVLMPEMDGYEACRQIKRKARIYGDTPIIMLTSKTSPFDKIKAKMAGCNSYLTKPIRLELLQVELNKFI